MDRTLPGLPTWPALPSWRPLRWGVYLLVAIWPPVSMMMIWFAISDPYPADYIILSQAGQQAGTASLYASDLFRYSPLYAWLLVPLGALTVYGWIAMHIAATTAFGSWRITLALLLAPPFWHDALAGNALIFVVLAAWWAVRGSRLAALIYLALCLLMLRPLMMPVAVWLLWKRPELRLPTVALAVLWAAGTLATGLTDEWLPVLLRAGGEMLGHPFNIGPSAIIGWTWLPIGMALAAWLTWKGRVGLASIAASPYVLPYYLLFAVLELGRHTVPHGPQLEIAEVGNPTDAGQAVPVRIGYSRGYDCGP